MNTAARIAARKRREIVRENHTETRVELEGIEDIYAFIQETSNQVVMINQKIAALQEENKQIPHLNQKVAQLQATLDDISQTRVYAEPVSKTA